MAHVIFFEKPGCGGNARQKRRLAESGHLVEARNLLSHPWTEAELRAFFGARPVDQWFNRAHPKVKSGALRPCDITAAQALSLMLADPLLIRRPLLQVGMEREVGWDEDRLRAWIGLAAGGVGEGCPRDEAYAPCPMPDAAPRPA